MDKEQARKIIEGFITQKGYTYTADRVVETYLSHYKQGYYVSHTMKDCIKHLEQELEVLSQ